MSLDFDLYSMGGPDFSKPRGLGAFVLAFKPSAFIDVHQFDRTMHRYMEAIRGSAAGDGMMVMAPGGREWATAADRDRDGVELDPETSSAFLELSQTFGVKL
jgi:LDH2 family malate/lactate/ureidoglycolate dehydrogenase